MIYATGTKNKVNGNYKMHSPKFPYNTIVYVGYSETAMKRKYREDFDLKGKHIEWIIL